MHSLSTEIANAFVVMDRRLVEPPREASGSRLALRARPISDFQKK
jgi:hypothetical protein